MRARPALNGPRIREMRPADVPVLDAVLRAAYGQPSSFAARLEAMLAQRTGRSFVALLGRRPAGMVFGNDYGTTAYVSLMGVDPSLQRRGIATALMQALCAWTDECGFADVQLDATPSGAPVYERFGFVDAGETVVYTGTGGGAGDARARLATQGDRDALLALDRAAFGADRAAMLGVLLGDPTTEVYVDAGGPVAYAALHGELIGPWVAADTATAASVFAAARSRRPGQSVRVSARSGAAMAPPILAAHGFARSRTLRHMVRGAVRPESPSLLGRVNLGQG